jgi:NADH:ubiquinone oxidoreductase subunit D
MGLFKTEMEKEHERWMKEKEQEIKKLLRDLEEKERERIEKEWEEAHGVPFSLPLTTSDRLKEAERAMDRRLKEARKLIEQYSALKKRLEEVDSKLSQSQ